MKNNLSIILLFLFIATCYGDPVDCLGVSDSYFGKYTYCNSSQPFPIKLESNILITSQYTFQPNYSWNYYLRSYKG